LSANRIPLRRDMRQCVLPDDDGVLREDQIG
jgi:hypothetical protein